MHLQMIRFPRPHLWSLSFRPMTQIEASSRMGDQAELKRPAESEITLIVLLLQPPSESTSLTSVFTTSSKVVPRFPSHNVTCAVARRNPGSGVAAEANAADICLSAAADTGVCFSFLLEHP